METLLSLTSKRAGDWFKEELRLLGGLDHVVDKGYTSETSQCSRVCSCLSPSACICRLLVNKRLCACDTNKVRVAPQ